MKAVSSSRTETQRLLECRPALVAPIHKTASELEQDGFQNGISGVGFVTAVSCTIETAICSSRCCRSTSGSRGNLGKNDQVTQGTAVCVGASGSCGIISRADWGLVLGGNGVTERIGISLNKSVCKGHNGIKLWKVGIVNGHGIFIRQLIVRIHAVEVKERSCQIGRSSSSGSRLCSGH